MGFLDRYTKGIGVPSERRQEIVTNLPSVRTTYREGKRVEADMKEPLPAAKPQQPTHQKEIPLKKCEVCECSKPANKKFFHKNKQSPDGLVDKCIVCTKTKNNRAVKKFMKFNVYQKYDSVKFAIEHKERAELKLIDTQFALDENEAMEICAQNNGIDKVCLVAVKQNM
jgi:hypothetical protein